MTKTPVQNTGVFCIGLESVTTAAHHLPLDGRGWGGGVNAKIPWPTAPPPLIPPHKGEGVD